MTLFEIRTSPVSLDECVRAVSRPEAGAVATFMGVVRNHNHGQPITLLEYQAYDSMAVKEMQRIAKGIAQEFLGVQLAAVHRVGTLKVGDTAVVCAASAAHRDQAFLACRALIDRIKAQVPVWKREHGPDGPYWVDWKDARCHGHSPTA